MDDKEKQKIDVIMKDYEILKTYSTITSPGVRYNLISIFFATIGIIISGTMIAIGSGYLSNPSNPAGKILSILLLFFVPIFCLAILYVWLGEEQRMMRIGEYLVLKEAAVNKKLGENVLDWETFKRNKSIQYPEILIIAIFLGLSFGFSLAGLYISLDYFRGLYRFLHLHNFTEAFWIDFIFHLSFGIFTYFFVKRNIVSIEKVKK